MAPVPIFAGKVDERGKLVLPNSEANRRSLYLYSLKNEDVEVIVRKKRVQRSLDQNAFLHAAVFPLLAKELCDSVEGIKFDLMGTKWGWTKTASGHHIPVKPHTSEMTVEECTEFIEWVIPWAMTTHGIHVPLPGEATA